MSKTTDKARKPSASARHRAARLMAVQAVYQFLIHPEESDIASLTAEYLAHRSGMEEDGENFVAPDPDMFHSLISGVISNIQTLQPLIEERRGSSETEAKPSLEPLLLALLLCGFYEIKQSDSQNFKIAVSDYVDVAHAFYDGREPGFVNALLDGYFKSL